MNIVIPQDEEQERTLEGDSIGVEQPRWLVSPEWLGTFDPDQGAERYGAVAADDDLDDFDEEDFDDEFDDDFEEELEDEYELSEFEDVTEEDLVEDDDLDTLGGDFVDEDAEPEEPPVADEEGAVEGKEGKAGKDAKSAKDTKKKGKPAKDDDEDFDDED